MEKFVKPVLWIMALAGVILGTMYGVDFVDKAKEASEVIEVVGPSIEGIVNDGTNEP
jgi:hypothetical protein